MHNVAYVRYIVSVCNAVYQTCLVTSQHLTGLFQMKLRFANKLSKQDQQRLTSSAASLQGQSKGAAAGIGHGGGDTERGVVRAATQKMQRHMITLHVQLMT